MERDVVNYSFLGGHVECFLSGYPCACIFWFLWFYLLCFFAATHGSIGTFIGHIYLCELAWIYV